MSDSIRKIMNWEPTLPKLEEPVRPEKPDDEKLEVRMTAHGDVKTPWGGKDGNLYITVENVFEGIVGFAAGTAIIEGPSFAECSGNLKDYINRIYEIIMLYEIEFMKLAGWNWSKFEVYPYLLINDKIIYLIWAIKNLTNGCYYGGFEVFYSMLDYIDWFYDPLIILFNCLYNAGFIYTIIRDFIFYFLEDLRTPIKTAYDIGKNIG